MEAGKRKKIVISVVILLVIAVIGGGVWFLSLASTEVKAAEVSSTQTPLKMSAYYIVLPEPFIFNVSGKERDRVVQIKVQLMVRGEQNEALANKHVPLVESVLLQTFAAATVEQLRQPQGREQLRQQALTTVQATMNKMTNMPVVERVLFTGFVMQ
ncbi:flagellar basal body-associated protein FliL [Photobacterium iliopiscarium]|jgi:flagellar FliL protein|uniref:Flagellar protein FliL n=1 Tax=Photobacterium iliopiscarium TaxID=56192 RepID=A0ABX5GV75_9GAMM|nr:flagellar basal body-associated protein FliL [Photobacterium iliopiscarium]KJG14865.1 flagellar basal body-associated protein FliL [Photobacterium iliopiscarium]KJG23533.1 flagellar basal body-associated protein FliL [Photobacterium iliopiscarium]PSU02095.1 flagellar basal body-associated protein FliL [Photobacterium iliopiscarium]PSV84444.1 flagellar basal body-associated protein FliL [Photobacterium iliopiscarium]PSW98724.1 flagellar basal body-associated protein FliL [Photobacterium ilio